MAKSCSFVVKTPTKSLKTDNAKTALEAFSNSILNNVLKVTINQAGARLTTQKERDLTVTATFFQRVCARTPLDEEYEYAKGRVHTPDDNQCRYDWYIEKKGKRVTAGDIHDSYSDVFDVVNNAQSIKAIETYLKFEFGNAIYEDDEFVIGNDNDHFAILEYGGYDKDGTIKEGPEYEHGVKNKHSVQAPVGMYRITRMELEALKRKVAKTPVATRFKRQKAMSKDFTKDQLKRLLSQFQANRTLKLSDIKRYLNI